MVYIPEQGDLIWLDFDPSSGREIIKRQPAFVLSRKAFNEHTMLAIVAPITSTVRGIKLEVKLPDENKTDGAILVHQLKSIDFIQRKADFIEKTPANIVEQVSSIAQLLVK
ncbi:MAG: type II toxin-antitoxin system PemK/MazF family toxin [Tatlockia sp.]|nr:type II toxin-antitoxin system PemK/MazF family toxin [Tatlockia sp.]